MIFQNKETFSYRKRFSKICFKGPKSGVVVGKLDSRSKGFVFESRIIQNTGWKWVSMGINSSTQFWFIHGEIIKI
jgi:hypothetical protein